MPEVVKPSFICDISQYLDSRWKCRIPLSGDPLVSVKVWVSTGGFSWGERLRAFPSPTPLFLYTNGGGPLRTSSNMMEIGQCAQNVYRDEDWQTCIRVHRPHVHTHTHAHTQVLRLKWISYLDSSQGLYRHLEFQRDAVCLAVAFPALLFFTPKWWQFSAGWKDSHDSIIWDSLCKLLWAQTEQNNAI